jgi:dCMP deaminase
MEEIDKKKWMAQAVAQSTKSGDPHLKVGAVIVCSEGEIDRSIGMGHNCLPSVFEYLGYKDENDRTRPEVIHAECEAIRQFIKTRWINKKGNTYRMFSTISPCMECAKVIYLNSIHEIYYIKQYKDIKPLEFLKSLGISCQQLDL